MEIFSVLFQLWWMNLRKLQNIQISSISTYSIIRVRLLWFRYIRRVVLNIGESWEAHTERCAWLHHSDSLFISGFTSSVPFHQSEWRSDSEVSREFNPGMVRISWVSMDSPYIQYHYHSSSSVYHPHCRRHHCSIACLRSSIDDLIEKEPNRSWGCTPTQFNWFTNS